MTANHSNPDRYDRGDDESDAVAGLLDALADSLLGALADNGGDVLVHVAESPVGVDVGTLALDGRHPTNLLLGTVAPDEWLALGVAAGGRARPLDGGQGEARRAETATLVHRSGAIVSRLRVDGAVSHAPPTHGVTLDCLQRVLGLATAPPLVPTGVLFAVTWLENAVRLAAGQGGDVTWSAVGAQHPAALLFAADRSVSGTGDLVATAVAVERACDWDRLRWLVVEGSWVERDLTPSEAAWFDAGSFSRWVLGQRPSLELLIGELKRVAPPRIARQCVATLRQMGLRLQRHDSAAA